MVVRWLLLILFCLTEMRIGLTEEFLCGEVRTERVRRKRVFFF